MKKKLTEFTNQVKIFERQMQNAREVDNQIKARQSNRVSSKNQEMEMMKNIHKQNIEVSQQTNKIMETAQRQKKQLG